MRIALCLLTWNELMGCQHDIPLIDKNKFDQLYCIDGGSTDGTVEYLKDKGIEVIKQSKKGYNSACKDAGYNCKCDAFVIYHPKGTIPVSDIYKFRSYFDQGYEFVIGSRMIKGAHNEEDNKIIKYRKWFVIALAFIAKILFKKEGNTTWDVLHGFRGMTVNAFNKMNISDFPMSFDIETCCRAYKYKIKRIEFPTFEKERIAGETHFKAFDTGKKLIKYIVWELFRKD